MNNKYFELARNEERSGNDAAALLLYGVVAKIRHLQHRLMLTDLQLFGLVHSYGPLTDSECKKLLDCSIRGTGISGYAYGY